MDVNVSVFVRGVNGDDFLPRITRIFYKKFA